MATKKVTTTPKTATKAPRMNWKTVYSDLPEKLAEILRQARVKPEQLAAKTDGDIMSIAGVTEMDLEILRAKYPASVQAHEAAVEAKEEIKEVAPVKAAVVSTSSRMKHPRKVMGRSARYKSLSKSFSRKDTLSLTAAVAKIKKYAKKDNTVDLHLNLFDMGARGEVKLPFGTGKSIRVEIFSDKTITMLNDNRFEFDVLLATPADMPKLAKFAKVLGPKGLMPNPKSGTVTADPQARAQALSAGATLTFKCEPKFPIIHTRIAKASQKQEEIVANIAALIKELGLNKIKNAYLTATQTPSVKIDLSSI